MFVNGSTTALETLSFTQSATAEPFTVTKTFTNAFTSYSTVRITTTSLTHTYGGTPESSIDSDKTFTIYNLSSLTSPIITTSSTNPLFYFASGFTSTSNMLHFKSTVVGGDLFNGTQAMYFLNATIDDNTLPLQISGSTNRVGAGLTLIQPEGGGSTFFIGTACRGQTNGDGELAGGVISITRPIVLANITSESKVVDLPNPATFESSYLCLIGYTTGTSVVTNRIYVNHKEYFERFPGESTYFTPSSGPSVGVLLVSDQTKWYLMGTYTGVSTWFDTAVGPYSALTSVIGLSTNDGQDSVTPGITPEDDSGVLQLWKTKLIRWANGAVVGGSGTALVVNGNYRRFYRNDNVDYSAYLFVTVKVGSSGTPTTFPIANYPNDN
jgi:hypothetical protein